MTSIMPIIDLYGTFPIYAEVLAYAGVAVGLLSWLVILAVVVRRGL